MTFGRTSLAAVLALVFAGVLALVIPFRSPPLAVPPADEPSVAPPSSPTVDAEAGPRLAVLIFFDQLRGDYLVRWDSLFIEGGFRRLDRDGSWFQNCHYPYAGTWTGPGHASVATGCSPDRHGIIGNDWYDAVALKNVSCVAGERVYEVVPPSLEKAEKKGRAACPEQLLSPTFADALKAATAGQARVISLSIKDRSAVLPGGQRPDACYWLDKHGRFVTSTYYRAAPHAWVRALNQERFADRWFGKKWERLSADLDYVRHSGPDDVRGEGTKKFGRTFPHPLEGKGKRPDATYYNALITSPFGNDLLLELARRAIDAEKLGQRGVPDFLSLSFSSNDLVGHVWGPDSQEVLDTTLRSDHIVKDLLDFLDKRVGKGRYVVALTADHGICPIPEVARAKGQGGGRIESKLLRQQAEAHLDKAFPRKVKLAAKEPWVKALNGPGFYLNRALIGRLRLRQADVEQALATWLRKMRGVQAAYTYGQLQGGVPETDAIGLKVRRSFHPDRSPDVVLVERPHYLLGPYLTGTNHGTPHAYDTHVPLLIYGPKVREGARRDLVTPQATAAILARAMNIKPPAHAEAPVPAGLFAEKTR
jgi:predicted AlkP superfamily pyrophosphatase or phosphodiesterase